MCNFLTSINKCLCTTVEFRAQTITQWHTEKGEIRLVIFRQEHPFIPQLLVCEKMYIKVHQLKNPETSACVSNDDVTIHLVLDLSSWRFNIFVTMEIFAF